MTAVTVLIGSATVALGWQRWAATTLESPPYLAYYQAQNDFFFDCQTSIHARNIVDCELGDPDSDTTIVLFGDSHANQWLPPLKAVAETHQWRLVALLKAACPVIFEEKYSRSLGRSYVECSEWRTKALARIQELSPALIVTSSSNGQAYSESAWRSGLRRAFDTLSLMTRQVIHITDAPRPGFDVPTCLARRNSGWLTLFERSCDFVTAAGLKPRVTAWERSAAAQHDNVTVIDLNRHVCPHDICETSEGDLVKYLDGHHMTASSAVSLADTLGEKLVDSLLNDPRR